MTNPLAAVVKVIVAPHMCMSNDIGELILRIRNGLFVSISQEASLLKKGRRRFERRSRGLWLQLR